MEVLVINGSRNPQGQTARATEALCEGARQAGCTVKTSYLPAMNLERCRQCDDDGWGICRDGGECVIEDDFAGLVDRIRSADLVVFSTPVYFSDLSESLKAFLDRFRRICARGAKADRIEGKPAIGLCVAGGGGGGAPRCAFLLESTLKTCGFDVVDMIPIRRQNLEMKTGVLSEEGKWLASLPTSS